MSTCAASAMSTMPWVTCRIATVVRRMQLMITSTDSSVRSNDRIWHVQLSPVFFWKRFSEIWTKRCKHLRDFCKIWRQFGKFLLNFWIRSVAKIVKIMQISKIAKSAPTLAIGGVDTEENEHCEVCPLSVYRSPRCVNAASGYTAAVMRSSASKQSKDLHWLLKYVKR